MEVVTHARVKFYEDKMITFVPIENVVEFKGRIPKNRLDFNKKKYYSVDWTDEKNPDGISSPAQICELACGIEEVERLQRKRPSFSTLSNTVLKEYEDSSEHDDDDESENKKLEEEKKISKKIATNVKKREKARQDEIINKKLDLLMNSKTLHLDNDECNVKQKEPDFSHPDSEENKINSDIQTNKEKIMSNLKMENKKLREELEDYKNKYLNISTKYAEQNEMLHSLQLLNIKLQNQFLCGPEKTSCGGFNSSKLSEMQKLARDKASSKEKLLKEPVTSKCFEDSLNEGIDTLRSTRSNEDESAGYQMKLVYENVLSEKEVNFKNKNIETLVDKDIGNVKLTRREDDKSPELSFGNNNIESEGEPSDQNKYVNDHGVDDKDPILSDIDLSSIDWELSPIISHSNSTSTPKRSSSHSVKFRLCTPKKRKYTEIDTSESKKEKKSTSKFKKVCDSLGSDSQSQGSKGDNSDNKAYLMIDTLEPKKEKTLTSKSKEGCDSEGQGSNCNNNKAASEKNKFLAKSKQSWKGKLVDCVYLGNDEYIQKLTWDDLRKCKKFHLFLKGVMRSLYTPGEIARRSLTGKAGVKTPNGVHTRQKMSPKKMKIICRCARHYWKKIKGIENQEIIDKEMEDINEEIGKIIDYEVKEEKKRIKNNKNDPNDAENVNTDDDSD